MSAAGWQVYIVGGAVRDSLLGLPVQDRDWVVVGATPQAMLDAGFRPVGKDFPVFLHPQTQEEYALARTERKTAPGYSGFAVHAAADVTLEEDLARRDLTINAMAEDEAGKITDPYGGQQDLAARVFRHVSPAFAEDPVRILRLARFAARFVDFSLAPETLQLMRGMVAAGEVDALVPERVWQELSRALMSERPSRSLQLLRECGALARLLPEVDALYGVPQPPEHHPEVDTGIHVGLVVDAAAARDEPLPVRFAALMHDLGKALSEPEMLPHHYRHEVRGLPLVEAVCVRFKVPLECRELALLACREHGNVHQVLAMGAKGIVTLLERCDAFRRPQRFAQLLAVCEADFLGRPGYVLSNYRQPERLRGALVACQSIDAGAIAKACADKSQIAEHIQAARQAAVSAFLAQAGA